MRFAWLLTQSDGARSEFGMVSAAPYYSRAMPIYVFYKVVNVDSTSHHVHPSAFSRHPHILQSGTGGLLF